MVWLSLLIYGYLRSNYLIQSFLRSRTIWIRIHVIAALYGSEVSRKYPYGCVFLRCKRAASVLPNEKLQNSKNFRGHKLHSSFFLFVRYFGSNELGYCNCYLQGPDGSKIADFGIIFNTSEMGGTQATCGFLSLEMWLFSSLWGAPNTFFCLAIALTPLSSSCVVKDFFFCSLTHR